MTLANKMLRAIARVEDAEKQSELDNLARAIFGREAWDTYCVDHLDCAGEPMPDVGVELEPVDEVRVLDAYNALHAYYDDDKEWRPPQAGEIASMLDDRLFG